MASEREQPNAEVHIPDARPDAPPDAAMALVIEGTNYSCKDGTVVGSASAFAREFFSRAGGLEPRHLLLGKEGGRWFLFTPPDGPSPISAGRCDATARRAALPHKGPPPSSV